MSVIMKIHLVLFTLLWWTSLLKGTPTLTASDSSVLIGRSLTLTCTFTNQPGFLGMTFNSSISQSCGIDIFTCSGAQGLCPGNTFTCSDDKLVYTFTLVHVNESFHDQLMNCYDSLHKTSSNVIKISVIVPVSTLNISPSMSAVDVVEGSNVNLTCSTDSSRPQSNITWYRNNVVIPGTTQTITSVAGDKYTTTSVLTVNGNRNLLGSQIYCSALNIQGRSPVTSSTKTINAKYAPSGTPVLTPTNPTVTEGNDVTLTCTLTQYGNPPATWTWSCVGRTVQQSEVTSTAGRSVLMFTTTRADNGRRCSCRAQSNIENYDQTSNLAVINVQYAPSGTPVLTPSNPTVIEGNDVTLTCTLTQYGNPPATWTWTCEGRTVQQSEVTSTTGQSVLRFTTTRADNGRRCSCRAQSNIGNYDQTSSTAVLNVQYSPDGPPTISGNPSGLQYNDSTSVSLTCTSGESNPAPTLTWNCNGLSKTEQTISTVLMFTVNKTFNGKTCECTATHPVENFRQQQRASLVVYYSGEILRVNQSHQQPHEGDHFIIEVQLDGNPPPTLTWINTDNNTVIKTDTTSGTSRYLNFPRINCLDTASYLATAFNGYGEAVNRSVHVSVFCIPRIDDSKTHLTRIPVEKNGQWNMSIYVISHPQSSVTLLKENKVISADINITVLRIRKVEYYVLLSSIGLNEDWLGNYTMNLRNPVGEINYTFSVISAEPPSPSGVTILCSKNKATVTWSAGDDRGDTQSFVILSKRENGEKVDQQFGAYIGNASSKRYSETIQIPEGLWIFTVEARNEYGRAHSSSAGCYIEGTTSLGQCSDAGANIGMFSAGFCTCLAITGSVALAICFKRRKGLSNKSRGRHNENTYDSIQGTSKNSQTYEDIRTDVQEDSKVYINTAFGN